MKKQGTKEEADTVHTGVVSPDFKAKDSDDFEVDVLGKTDMLKICGSVEELGKNLVAAKSIIGEIEKLTKGVEKLAKNAKLKDNSVASGQADGEATDKKTARKLALNTGKIVQAMATQVPSLALRTGVAALKLCRCIYE